MHIASLQRKENGSPHGCMGGYLPGFGSKRTDRYVAQSKMTISRNLAREMVMGKWLPGSSSIPIATARTRLPRQGCQAMAASVEPLPPTHPPKKGEWLPSSGSI